MPGIEHATVAILNANSSTPSGTGFLVGDRHVLTCAHVVGDALGDDSERHIARSGNKPDNLLQVRFTVVESPTILPAQVVMWSRYYKRDELVGTDGAAKFKTRDLALLHLEKATPPNVKPARLWDLGNSQNIDRIFGNNILVAAGYPQVGSNAFFSIPFTFDFFSDGNELMVEQVDTDYDADDLAGLSGAALVLKKYGLVIGIVLETDSHGNRLVVKPTHQLRQFYAEMRVVCHGSELQNDQKIPPRCLLDIDRVPQLENIVNAAQTASTEGSKIMLAAILGECDNCVEQWLDHIIDKEVQFIIEEELPIWVKPVSPIFIHRRERLDADALFKMAMINLAQKLGISSKGNFIETARCAFNGENITNGNRTEPPPYLIFQFSARNFGEFELHVLLRLVQFWEEVAEGGLDTTQLIFFSFISKNMDKKECVDKMQSILSQIRETIRHSHKIELIEPLPGVCCKDSQEWLNKIEDDLDEQWDLDPRTANRIKSVITDIFQYEVEDDMLSLRTFQSELEKLDLCRQDQEG